LRKTHTDQQYEAELEQLRSLLLTMGARVEEMMALSVRALVERDDALARRVLSLDGPVDRLEMDSDELCMRILARRQPVASDLRFVTSALKLVTDLERIGDLAVNACERVLELDALPALPEAGELPAMAHLTQEMVHEALDAFVRGDVDLARKVIERDRLVDAAYEAFFSKLLQHMIREPRDVMSATRLQSIAKYLERVGDHACNLAEMVVFMVSREDIRHRGKV